jgi:hypothetical protein
MARGLFEGMLHRCNALLFWLQTELKIQIIADCQNKKTLSQRGLMLKMKFRGAVSFLTQTGNSGKN